MKCNNCAKEVTPGNNTCTSCGYALNKCPKCGHNCHIEAKFCDECGQKLISKIIEKTLTPSAITHPDLPQKIHENIRKHGTILFADMKGSTALIQNLDPEEASNILSPALKEMLSAVHRYDGSVIHTAGDGIVAIFGAPHSLEDHALRACLAALSIQNKLKFINPEIKIRVGLNSGEVLMRVEGDEQHLEYDITGPAVNLAARMEQTAKPGTIQITKDTLILAENFIQSTPLGSVEVKGFYNPIEVFELKSIKESRLSFEIKDRPIYSSFIGRDDEINLLNELLIQTKKGKGSAINIVAQVGLGKSRICYEFIHSEKATDCTILMTGGLSHTKNIILSPIINLFRDIMDIGNLNIHQDEEKIKKIIQPYIGNLDSPYAFSAALSLLDITSNDEAWKQLHPALKHKNIFKTGIDILTELSLQKPVVLIVEDLHWVDDETNEFLNVLISILGKFPILLLSTCRLEYQDQWVGKSNYNRLVLQPLTLENQKSILTELLGDDPSLIGIKEKILTNSGGNPFFIEETIKLLISDKMIVGSHNHYQLNIITLIEKAKLPETIYSILQSQLDKLSPVQKKTLQVSSVIGEQFTYNLISQLIDLDQKELRESINALCEEQYIYEASLYPEPVLAFKNAMIQEVSYQNLLISNRKVLHSKLLTIFENLFVDPQPGQIQIMANHAFLSEEWEKAFSYNLIAAKNAFLMNAFKLSLHLYTQALHSADHFPHDVNTSEKLFYAHSEVAHLYLRIGQFEKRNYHQEKSLEIAKQSNNLVLQSVGFSWKAISTLGMSNVYDAIEYADHAYALAQESKSDDVVWMSQCALLHVYLFTGQYDKLFVAGNELIQNIPNLGYFPKFARGTGIGYISYFIMLMGWSLTGNFANTKAIQHVLDNTNMNQISVPAFFANIGIGYYLYRKGDYSEALPYLVNGFKNSIELEIIPIIPIATALGCIYYRQGNKEEGIKYIYQGINLSKTINFVFFSGLTMDMINEVLFLLGKPQESKELINLSLKICEQRQLLSQKPALLRLAAEVDLQLPNPNYSAIEHRIKEALEMAKKFGLQPEVAHCHLALSKVYQKMENDANFTSELKNALHLYKKLGMSSWIADATSFAKNLA